MATSKLTKLLRIEHPIIQAPMAGGVTTPLLVAAVSNAGGLGSLGAGYMQPEQLRTAIKETQRLTDRPFAVNLFIPEKSGISLEKAESANRNLQSFRSELEIEPLPVSDDFAAPFEEQLAVLIEEHVPIFSFTFGIPSANWIEELKNRRITLIGTATTVNEAQQLEASDVDIIVGQGSEAGGHRGTFTGEFETALIGTMALIPQLVDHVNLPVIAAGGIMDGRGIAAAFALGAMGVQLGTAFLSCPESGAHSEYKKAILHSTDESTVLTRAFSGKPARGIKNRFILEMNQLEGDLPPYPLQNSLTRDIRQAAAKQNRPEFMSLWAGQASRLSQTKSAGELVTDLAADTARVLNQLHI